MTDLNGFKSEVLTIDELDRVVGGTTIERGYQRPVQLS